MTRRRILLFVVGLAVLVAIELPGASVAGPGSHRIHIEPGGDDAGPGTRAEPLATLERARDLLRTRRSRGAWPPGGAEVVIGAGRYPCDASFLLEQQDGGRDGAPVRYVTAAGEDVVLFGGIEIAPEHMTAVSDPDARSRLPTDEARGHVRVVDLKALGIDRMAPVRARGFGRSIEPAPAELFLDGRALTLARWPNEGFVETGEVVDPGARPRDGDTSNRVPRFRYDGTRPARWTRAEDAWAYGYWFHDWADESLPLAHVDVEKKEIRLGAPHRYSVKKGKPYFVENLLEELDSAGEYYVDRRRLRLYVWPPGEGRWVLSRLASPLISLSKAAHVHLVGLTIETTRGDGVAIEDGQGVRLERCTVRSVGARAVTVRGGKEHTIVRCRIHETGEGGIDLEGGDRMRLIPSRHVVTGCDVSQFSRRTSTYRPAVRLSGCGHRVTHNHMHHAPHAAVIFGGNDHVISKNEIDHVLTRTGDGGAIYCGRDWTLGGTVIRDNHLHDLRGIGKWENAIYIDDQASGITITGNLIERCHLGLLMGGGRRNVIAGNVIVDCDTALRFGARGLGWAARMRPLLEERLAAVPYREEPWRSRFPWLLTLLDDAPMAPRHNVIRGNTVIRSGRLEAHLATQVRDHGEVEGNRHLESLPRDLPRERWADVGPRPP